MEAIFAWIVDCALTNMCPSCCYSIKIQTPTVEWTVKKQINNLSENGFPSSNNNFLLASVGIQNESIQCIRSNLYTETFLLPIRAAYLTRRTKLYVATTAIELQSFIFHSINKIMSTVCGQFLCWCFVLCTISSIRYEIHICFSTVFVVIECHCVRVFVRAYVNLFVVTDI